MWLWEFVSSLLFSAGQQTAQSPQRAGSVAVKGRRSSSQSGRCGSETKGGGGQTQSSRCRLMSVWNVLRVKWNKLQAERCCVCVCVCVCVPVKWSELGRLIGSDLLPDHKHMSALPPRRQMKRCWRRRRETVCVCVCVRLFTLSSVFQFHNTTHTSCVSTLQLHNTHILGCVSVWGTHTHTHTHTHTITGLKVVSSSWWRLFYISVFQFFQIIKMHKISNENK